MSGIIHFNDVNILSQHIYIPMAHKGMGQEQKSPLRPDLSTEGMKFSCHYLIFDAHRYHITVIRIIFSCNGNFNVQILRLQQFTHL